MAFNDGAPIDAAQLAKLEQRLALAEASIPKVGATTSVVSNATGTATAATTTPKGVLGGVTDLTATLTPGAKMTPMTVAFDGAGLGTPTSVVISLVHGESSTGKYDFNPYVYNVTASGFTIGMYVGPNSTGGAKTRFSWIALFG